MRDDQRIFLTIWGRPPFRLNVEQTAWVLNCQVENIPILVRAGLLRPLGNPPRSGTKYFGADEVSALARDPKWLAKYTNAIHQHWHDKNKSKGKEGRL